MKKRNSSALLFVVLCAGLLTGCGGEYAGMTEGDIVSGSAVSGAAVSGDAIREKTVSGPAVEDGKKKFRHEEKQDMSSHRFCTDTNLYYVNEDEDQIMQARVDGTHRKCIWECEDKEYDEVELLYVDKDWLYYHVELDGDIIYRAPIGKDVQGYDVVRFSQEEEIIKTYSMSTLLYMDSDYCFYTDDMDELIKYDLKRKEIISSKEEEFEFIFAGNIIRLKDHYFCSVDTGCCYVQKIDSGRWKKICDRMVDIEDMEEDIIEEYIEECIYYKLSVSNDREAFYPQYVTKKGEQKSQFEIRRHDGEQEREFVTWEQLSQAVEEVTRTQKMDVCMPDQLFWQEGRLYIQLQTGWVEDGTYHMEYMMFSQGEDDSGLRYEKSLTECMKSYVKERKGKWTNDDEKDETVYVEHMTVNDAQCIAMVDGKAYLSLYDYENGKGRLGCYELKNEKFEWISKTDNTFYKLGYDQNMNYLGRVFDQLDDDDDYDNAFADVWYWSPSKDKWGYGYFVEG